MATPLKRCPEEANSAASSAAAASALDLEEEVVWAPAPKRQRIETADENDYNFTQAELGPAPVPARVGKEADFDAVFRQRYPQWSGSKTDFDGGQTAPQASKKRKKANKAKIAKSLRKGTEKKTTGKVFPSEWTATDRSAALKYLQEHTLSAKSASGCRQWNKNTQGAKFRKVVYPSVQTFAFAAQIQDPPLMQRMKVESKCGNALCVTPTCLILVYNRMKGPKNFLPMTSDALVQLYHRAANNAHIGIQRTRIDDTQLRELHRNGRFAELEQRLKPEA
jgi:hypothetical protein